MALNQSRGWLIAYDIADKRRLSRLHRFIKKNAVPVQYSLYWFEGSATQVDRLLRQVESYIDARYDDVRAYPIPKETSIESVGRGSLPAGLSLLVANEPLCELLTAPCSAMIRYSRPRRAEIQEASLRKP